MALDSSEGRGSLGIDPATGTHPDLVLGYVNSQYGSTIDVYPDGTMVARKADGKRKKTSATPLALYEGHGKWVLESIRKPEVSQ